MNDYLHIRSILAGLCIALGSAIFCKLGGVIGAVMFAFGLLAVVHYKLPLYTGMAGFFDYKNENEWLSLVITLIGNIIGASIIIFFNIPDINETATNIIQSRLVDGYINCFVKSIGCGIIMTLIVQGGRDNNLLLILFGIPLFILLGFYHSIADFAYLALSTDTEAKITYFINWFIIVLGNFVGCNIPRLLHYKC